VDAETHTLLKGAVALGGSLAFSWHAAFAAAADSHWLLLRRR